MKETLCNIRHSRQRGLQLFTDTIAIEILVDLTSSVGQNIFSLIKVIMSPKGKKSNDRNAYRLITNNIFVFFFIKKDLFSVRRDFYQPI